MSGLLGRWVDARVRAALQHVVEQLDDPDSQMSRAVGEQVGAMADKVGDRVDQSLARIPLLVDQAGDKVREDVRSTMLNLVPDAATMAQQVAEAVKGLIGGGFRPFGIAATPKPPFGPGGPGVEYREPEGHE